MKSPERQQKDFNKLRIMGHGTPKSKQGVGSNQCDGWWALGSGWKRPGLDVDEGVKETNPLNLHSILEQEKIPKTLR